MYVYVCLANTLVHSYLLEKLKVKTTLFCIYNNLSFPSLYWYLNLGSYAFWTRTPITEISPAFFLLFLLRKGLTKLPRLVLNFLCSSKWPWPYSSFLVCALRLKAQLLSWSPLINEVVFQNFCFSGGTFNGINIPKMMTKNLLLLVKIKY